MRNFGFMIITMGILWQSTCVSALPIEQVLSEEKIQSQIEDKLAKEFFLIAMDNFNNHQYQQAKRNLEKVLTLVPRDKHAQKVLEETKYKLEILRSMLAAKDAIERKIDNDKTGAESKKSENWTIIGIAEYYTGDFYQAIKTLNTAIELDPKNGNASYHRGMSYTLLFNRHQRWSYYLQARDDMEAACLGGFADSCEHTSYMYYSEARLANKDKKYEIVIELLTKSLQYQPDQGNVYLIRATARQQLEQWKAAIRDLYQAIELLPAGSYLIADSFYKLGLINQYLKHLELAKQYYTTACTLGYKRSCQLTQRQKEKK